MAISAKEMRMKSTNFAASVIEAIEDQIVKAAEAGKYKIFYDLEDLVSAEEYKDESKRFIYHNIIKNTFRERGFSTFDCEISWEYRG